jgi:hypothetical protein
MEVQRNEPRKVDLSSFPLGQPTAQTSSSPAMSKNITSTPTTFEASSDASITSEDDIAEDNQSSTSSATQSNIATTGQPPVQDAEPSSTQVIYVMQGVAIHPTANTRIFGRFTLVKRGILFLAWLPDAPPALESDTDAAAFDAGALLLDASSTRHAHAMGKFSVYSW